MAASPVKKALTLRASSIGDTLMGKYFLENIHASWPDAELTLLVGSRVGMVADLLKAYEWLHVIEVNRKHIPRLIGAARALRGQDLTLTQYAENPFSLPSKIFARLVTKRGGFVGFTDRFWGNRFLYDTLVPFEGELRSDGMIVEEQKALRAAGVPVLQKDLTLSYVADEGVYARYGVEPRRYVLVHVFSGNEGRSISQAKRCSVVQALRDALPVSYTMLLTGVAKEYERAVEAAQGRAGIEVLAGKTSVQEMCNLIAGAGAVLALDSGAAHMAAHIGVPLAVLCRNEALTGWWGSAMYHDRPHVLTNGGADDTLPRDSIYPPSMETIDNSVIVATVAKLLN